MEKRKEAKGGEFLTQPDAKPNARRMVRRGIRTYLLCVYIASIIYAVVVIENYYQKNILDNPNQQPLFVIGSILFMGFMVFVLVAFSPLFRKFIFRMFGAEEELKGEQK